MSTKVVDKGYERIKREMNKLKNTTLVIKSSMFYAGFLEFGTKHMPPRPFMRQAFENNYNDIVKKIKQGQADIFNGGTAEGAANKIGQFCELKFKQEIRDGNFEPLQPETIAKKGHAQTLIDSRDLIKSIEYTF